ncbi:hypothetical protein V5O48_010980 [Marasmius crinis-equi]|uniref:PPPDE domain-containing protein n=1 Tax=Marasmius crinis-equi TaxID=585013 RepID=A0ABR3F6Z8_9AGAR
MSSQPTPSRWSLVSLFNRLFSGLMDAITDTRAPVTKTTYAVCHCFNLPQAQSFTPQMFENMVQDVDLACTVRAIALCKRTDRFQHETLIAVISLPGESTEALVFIERAGCWKGWSLRAALNASAESSSASLPVVNADPTQPQEQDSATLARDIITLLPKPSLFWKYATPGGSSPPFDQLPVIVKNSSNSSPSPDSDTLAKNEADQSRESVKTKGDGKAKYQGGTRRLFKSLRRQPEPDPSDINLDQPSANSNADHTFIYAITFPGENCEPPSVLDLAIVSKLVSEHRPSYSLVQHNCYFFAAAICKVMEQRFGGKKIRNFEFQESEPPPSWHDVQASSSTDTHPQAGVYHHQWLRKGNLKPIQILREDGPYFTEMVQELVTKFDDEREMHPVIKSRQTEGRLQQTRDELTETRARLTETEERMREMQRRLQQFEQPSSTLPGR